MMRDSSRELPAEEAANLTADHPVEDEPEAAAAPDESAPAEEPALPEEEAQPSTEEEQPSNDPPAPEEPAPLPAKPAYTRAHPLWRGWWLAICLLTIAVLMGKIDAFGVAWRRQPWRAFGGAVAAGGFLAALPGLIRRDLPERPTLRRCLLGLFIGLVWGVLG